LGKNDKYMALPEIFSPSLVVLGWLQPWLVEIEIQLLRHSIDFVLSQMTVTSRSTNQLPRWPYKNHDIHSRILF